MRFRHVGMALAVAVVWGVNFVALDDGLRHYPPLLFTSLRFAATALLVVVIPRPRVAWRWIVVVGLLQGALQQGLTVMSLRAGLPAGLASVLLQSQALFTLAIAAVVLGERPRRRQLVGVAVAVLGVGVIAFARGGSVRPLALLILLGAAASWGGSNVVIRTVKPPDALALLVWSSLVSPVPLFALSALTEGHAFVAALTSVDSGALLALGYVVVVSTLGGMGAWVWLLGRYPASTVAPYSLLVPIFGMSAAYVALGERPSWWELVGAAVAIAGMAVVVSRPRPVSPVVPVPEPVGAAVGAREMVRQI